jgi:hypothetical protein
MRDPNHHVLAGAKNIDNWHTGKGDLQRAFPLDVSMVLSYAITIATDGEHLTCDGFSLSKIVRLGNFKFIADYFGSLSLSPKRGDTGAAFMGSTHSGASTPWRTMIEDTVEEILTVSSGEGAFTPPPSPRRHATGLCLLPLQPHHG